MVEEYLSDREQEEALRSWWNENWRWIVSGLLLGLVAWGGWLYWRQQTVLRAEAGAQAFSDLAAVIASGDKDKVEKLVQEIDSSYAKSPYADQAHLALAQNKVAMGQFEQAASELKIVIEKSQDPALVQVARLRLARVQLQLGHPDEALALLDVSKAGAFAGQVHEVRGDALLAKGDRSGARLAYQAAVSELAGLEQSPASGELLRLKLQDLSDAEAVVEQPASASPEGK